MSIPDRIWINEKWEAYLRPTFEGDTSGYIRADLAAVQPAQVRVKPWSYCPECGCEEPRYGEGPHKQCARCYQEWFTDVDYSGVVRGNLERLFIAALEPQPDPREEVITRMVEAVHNCVGMLDQLVAESGRLVEWDAEDPFRMGEWFEPEDLAQIESARAALAAAKAVQSD